MNATVLHTLTTLLAWVLWVQAVALPQENPRLETPQTSVWIRSTTFATQASCQAARDRARAQGTPVTEGGLRIRFNSHCLPAMEESMLWMPPP